MMSTHHVQGLFVCVGEKQGPLSWDLRVYIALDVARGLEYLHDGVSLHLNSKNELVL